MSAPIRPPTSFNPSLTNHLRKLKIGITMGFKSLAIFSNPALNALNALIMASI